MKLLQQINNAYCVLLDKRIDLWQPLKQSFQEKGINLQRFLSGDGKLNEKYDHVDIDALPNHYNNSINYRTWYERPAPLNCWIAHKKIMQKSLSEGFDHVLIVEDDAFIEDDFSEILEETEDFWANNKYDMIYFGSYLSEGEWRLTSNEHVLKLDKCCGWHGVLLTKPVMEELITAPPIGPFDWICAEYVHSVYDCFAIYPSIISQKSGFSYVENGNLEKPDRFKR